ncbi:MAG: flagellar protein FlbD [Phycisphaeraceae bacterium]|nr:MAG: flagellar protein FlbD [Phycisphaeraceae bacterium]
MISVTRLNGARFVLNAELIRTIESNPDTIVTLITGERLIVREPMREIVQKAVDYGRLLRRSVGVDLPADMIPEAQDPPTTRDRAG